MGLVLYATFNVLWPTVGSPAETTMALLGLVSLLVWGRGLRKGAALWLLLLAIVVQVLSWTLGYFHHPEWMADNPQIDRLAKLFVFMSVAWWLAGSTRNTLLVWGLALIGLLAATFVQGGGLEEWLRGLQGKRVDFSIRNAQHTAMYFGVALLGLIAFSKRCVFPGRFVIWRLALWLLALIICLAGVLITQTRAIWLALCVALPVMGGIWGVSYAMRHGAKSLWKPVLIFTAVVMLGLAGLGAVFQDTISKRLDAEGQVIANIIKGDIESVSFRSSIGNRIHTWVAASEWIKERPFVGWGSEGRGLVIEQTEWLPDYTKREFNHLHNFFLEVWVAYGLLGLTVIGALAIWVGRATWLAWQGGVLPSDMAIFGVCFFIYWLIINQFESYNSFWTGVYVHNMVLGGLVTHYWRWQLENKPKGAG